MNKQEIEKAIEELKYQEDMRAKGIDYQVDNLVINTAVSALEKQIPKKPEWNLQNDAILCPCCGLDLMGGVEIDSEIDPEHCWNCGQAIDWRNEDE